MATKKKAEKRAKDEPAGQAPASAFSVPVYNDAALEVEWEEREKAMKAKQAEDRRRREEEEARREENRKERAKTREGAMRLSTTTAEYGDRMLRHRRNPPCPKCGAHPSVCTQRRGAWAAFRCRQCGHRWEVF